MRSSIWALAALLLATGPAFAGGGSKGDVEVGVYGGYGWLDDYGAIYPNNNKLWGGRIGYFFSDFLSLEFSGQRLATESDSLGPTEVDTHIDSFRGNLLLNFGAGNAFRPFITGGIGYEKIDAEDVAENSDLQFNGGVGFRWFFTPKVNLRADGKFVATKVQTETLDEMQKNAEATIGLGIMFGGGGDEEPTTTGEALPAPTNQAPTVTCSAERSEIQAGESVTVTATATDPEGDPLTYAWSTTAGRVTGTTATATFDFSGATAPSRATVTVRVTDNHGNSATCDAAVAMAEPAAAKPAEAVSCLAGGFPRNLARLNNVDKACLDDVAQRLKADPRASVTIVGHADNGETNPDRVGEQRANAVRDYLAREQAIEASRITVKSAGATKTLETGTDVARNRRVEVWFVPAGATIPGQ